MDGQARKVSEFATPVQTHARTLQIGALSAYPRRACPLTHLRRLDPDVEERLRDDEPLLVAELKHAALFDQNRRQVHLAHQKVWDQKK